MILESAVALYIYRGRGLTPLGIETITKTCKNRTPNQFWQGKAV
jgi:hypothetical protein